MNLLKWFQKRKQLIKHSKYNSGYDYAAGALLREDKTPLELDAEQVCDDRDSFDYGMDAAIQEAINLGIVKDNRV